LAIRFLLSASKFDICLFLHILDIFIESVIMSIPSDLNRVLTAHGYAIKKSSLTPRSTQRLRKDLTVAPIVSPKFARMSGGSASFTVYTESPTRFYVPRCWATEVWGDPEANVVPEGQYLSAIHGRFVGKPYDYQEGIIQTFLEKGANGLICVPCGKGKTFMALAIASRLRLRFLIVVDKEFLMNQWKSEIQAVMPDLRVGIVQGDKLEVDADKYDCTICMIQTLVQREYPQTTFRSYGFTIFDECHHLGAAHFSRALLKIQTKYMLGLSATPTRDDGLTKVFEWFLGKPVYWEKTREPDPSVIVQCQRFTTEDPIYNEVPTDYRGEMIMARLLTRVVECKERNEKIRDLLVSICQEPLRKVLVLSERIGHLEAIEALVKAENPELTMSYYIGGMKEEKRESGAATSRILLASYAMASEAMNIKTLNTVILASPRKKVEQSTGRILRIRPDQRQIHPLIVDIVDSHSIYIGQWRKRAQYYKKCSYKIVYGEDSSSDSEDATKATDGECLISDD
jgi:superfamily II DNA or RNA helicase